MRLRGVKDGRVGVVVVYVGASAVGERASGMRAPTTSNGYTTGARKGSNGNDGREKWHSDGGVNARRDGPSVMRLVGGWHLEGKHDRWFA